jgi:2-methylcitrate dehydratase PrpD
LGERYETMRVSLKFYACVGSTHTTLDALSDIRKRRPFTASDIERIVVHASQVTVEHAGWVYRPEGLTAAQLNLPFCAGTLILAGDAFVDQFTPDCVNDRARIELAGKVQVIHDPAITALGPAHRHQVRVEVHFRDGGIEREMRDAPRGSEENFAGEAQIVGKFRKLTGAVMREQQQNALIEAVLRLERLPDSRTMIALLRPV